jgi:L-aminoacid ligase-like protein
MPGITGLAITVPVGERVHLVPEGDRRLGATIAEADTSQGIAAALCAARSQLPLTIQ